MRKWQKWNMDKISDSENPIPWALVTLSMGTLENTEFQSGNIIPPSFSYRMMTSSNGNIFRVTSPLWGNPSVTGGFPTQRSVTRSFEVFFDLRLNKRLSKQSIRRWIETSSRSLWRHCNELKHPYMKSILFPILWFYGKYFVEML